MEIDIILFPGIHVYEDRHISILILYIYIHFCVHPSQKQRKPRSDLKEEYFDPTFMFISLVYSIWCTVLRS